MVKKYNTTSQIYSLKCVAIAITVAYFVAICFVDLSKLEYHHNKMFNNFFYNEKQLINNLDFR